MERDLYDLTKLLLMAFGLAITVGGLIFCAGRLVQAVVEMQKNITKIWTIVGNGLGKEVSETRSSCQRLEEKHEQLTTVVDSYYAQILELRRNCVACTDECQRLKAREED